jgi:predicted ester cyclase
MTETDEVKLNDINEEGLIDHSSKNKSLNNQIIVYSLFAVTMILIIGGVILLLLSLRVKDETKENAELVTKFFKDGYEYKNFDKVMTYMSDNYYDHSPASARSNADAVNILKSVANFFSDVKVEMLDLTCEKDMVAARLLFKVVHTGEYNGIPATGKTITYEALENFKVVNGIIVESWGYWPDKQIEEKLKAN